MTQQIELKDALASWPPFSGSGRGLADNDPPAVELGDTITHARLSGDGYLVLTLKGGNVASELVKEEYRVLLGRELQNIISKTVGEAGSILLCVA